MTRIPRTVTALLVAAACSVANAAVIYQDNFVGSDGSPLNGAAPDVRPGSETWSAAANYEANGDVNSSGNASAWLPVTIAQGHVYVLSGTFTTLNTDAGWLALSFATSDRPEDTWYQAPDGYGAYLNRGNGDASTYTGLNTTGATAYTGIHSDGVVTVAIMLDATDADSANWTIAWSATGNTGSVNQTGTLAADGDYGNIAHIGFSNSASGDYGTLSSMTFELVPEPATMGLLAGGALAMLKRRGA